MLPMSLLCIAWKTQSNLCAALNLSLGCLCPNVFVWQVIIGARGGGQGGLNLLLPVPFNPGSRPVFFGSHLRNRTKIGYNTMVKSVIEGHKYGCLYHVIISTINDSLRFPNYSIIHFKKRYKIFYVLICLFRF